MDNADTDGTDYATTTDSDGDCTMEDVDPGSYTAAADADGYEPESKEINVDGNTEVNFALTPASDGGGGSDDGPRLPWGVERTGAAEVHDDVTGQGVSVYIIDSGIDATHVDLEPNLAPDVDNHHEAVVSCRGGGCDTEWDDDYGHGTHVAGTAAATDADQVVGMAPDATLHAVKVLSNAGIGSRSDVIAGIDWMTGHVQESDNENAAVANISLGGSGSKDGDCTDQGFTGDDSYHDAIRTASHVGVVFAVAAGNSDADVDNTVPAAYHDTVLTVSAVEQDEDAEGEIVAEFSNWGDDYFGWTQEDEDDPLNPQSAPVALAAPGVDVLSTWPDDELHEGSGTSMAAPHVAGGAALLIADGGVSSDGRQAFLDARAALMGEGEDTSGWADKSSFVEENDAGLEERQESFLDVRFLSGE